MLSNWGLINARHKKYSIKSEIFKKKGKESEIFFFFFFDSEGFTSKAVSRLAMTLQFRSWKLSFSGYIPGDSPGAFLLLSSIYIRAPFFSL